MLICRDCGRTFSDPDTREERTGVSSEGWHETETISTCPFCGSDEIQEAVHCEFCGDWAEDWTCKYCKEEIKKMLENIVEVGLTLQKLNGQKPDRYGAINAIAGELEDM